jgi:hypothetical protein
MADAVDYAERDFPFSDLIEIGYFKKYKKGYYQMLEKGYQLNRRNYLNLITFLKEIFEYNQQHAKGFAKDLRSASNSKNWNNFEAIFSEIIVYHYYIRLVYEGIINSIHRNRKECDLIVKRLDNSLAFLEVFCVNPNLTMSKEGEVIVQDIKTHLQEEMASIRQKILFKIKKQNQLTKPRDNYAVIELNDPGIAGDFAVLSSLSGGYKITINTKTMETISSGYDWNYSIFHDESTKFLKAIIYFSLGDYESRKFIFNPRFKEDQFNERVT